MFNLPLLLQPNLYFNLVGTQNPIFGYPFIRSSITIYIQSTTLVSMDFKTRLKSCYLYYLLTTETCTDIGKCNPFWWGLLYFSFGSEFYSNVYNSPQLSFNRYMSLVVKMNNICKHQAMMFWNDVLTFLLRSNVQIISSLHTSSLAETVGKGDKSYI